MSKARINTLKVAAILAVALPIINASAKHINVVTSESIDHRIFWRTNAPPVRNDYVLLDVKDPAIPGQVNRVTKQVRCIGGDFLERIDDVFLCNGEYLGHVVATNSEGTPLPQFHFSGEIPDGKAFVMGTNPLSYDSRYWGLITLKNAERVTAIF